MTPVWWLIAASAGSALAASALAGDPARPAIVFGMGGPLVAAVFSWRVVEHAYRVDPLRVQAVLLKAWAAKAVFLAVWMVVGMVALGLPATPLAVSFTVYFVLLYAAVAVLMRRLFSGGVARGPAR
jgi:hypothetical protein